MGQMSRISTNNTKVAHDAVGWTVHLHGHLIIRREGNTITIDTCGYNTVTTRARVNQACNEFGLPFGVGCHQGNIFVAFDQDFWGEKEQAHYMLHAGEAPDRAGRFFFDQVITLTLIGE